MGKKADSEIISSGINRICAGTNFVGNVDASSDIRIDGNLDGNLTTRGKLVVGETGEIKGDIICKNADILGVINGKLSVSDFLVLKSTAKVKADVTTGRILIEAGAFFSGLCNMVGGESNNS
jgi:cytoskeletal protein CcmA (bactofilin family)